MARKTRNRWILLVVMAMVLATVGLVYAHWQGSLFVDGQVNTGGMNLSFGNAWTNDDGIQENDPTGTDFGGNDADPNYDAYEDSSRDPANDTGSERYLKDVAGCWADAGGDQFNFNIDNAYPSYHCLMGATVFGEWSVPVKATALYIDATKYYVAEDAYCGYYETDGGAEIDWYSTEEGDYFDVTGDGPTGDDVPITWEDGYMGGQPVVEGHYAYGELYNQCDETVVPMTFAADELGFFDLIGDKGVELTGEFDIGIACGTQIDPGQEYGTQGWLHIEQAADMGARYELHMTQEYVNWNEFDESMCIPKETIEVVSSQLNFSSTGWGGWSCPATHPNPVGYDISQSGTDRGIAPAYPIDSAFAVPSAELNGSTYPDYPHYDFGSGEMGVVAQNGGTPQNLFIWIDCQE